MEILETKLNEYGEACYLIQTGSSGEVVSMLAAEYEASIHLPDYNASRPVFFKNGDGHDLMAENLTQQAGEVSPWVGSRKRRVVCTDPETGEVHVMDSIKSLSTKFGVSRGSVSVALFYNQPLGGLNVRHYFDTLPDRASSRPTKQVVGKTRVRYKFEADGVKYKNLGDVSLAIGSTPGSLSVALSRGKGKARVKGVDVKKL